MRSDNLRLDSYSLQLPYKYDHCIETFQAGQERNTTDGTDKTDRKYMIDIQTSEGSVNSVKFNTRSLW